jgi:hypothetical protein
MRIRAILASTAVAAAPLAAVGLATAAHASTPVTATAVTHVSARLDSGYAGNNWASDTITRTVTVTLAGTDSTLADCGDVLHCYNYTGTIHDTGTAQAITGETSPGAEGMPIKGSPTAAMVGNATVTFHASSNTPSAKLVPTTLSGNHESTSNWVEQFFPTGTQFGAGPQLPSFRWTYTDSADCQTWVDALTVPKADSGDITGTNMCPVVSHGHATVTDNGATVTWQSTMTDFFQVTITGPGKINGRTAMIHQPKAVYSGLEAGHNYSVKVQPLVNGKAAGRAGVIDFKTTRS